MTNAERRMSSVAALLVVAAAGRGAGAELPDRALGAMKKATAYFTTEVACHGGYLWRYSQDLEQRYGEGKATETQVWVQPPGTPSVGLAFVRAYEATGDKQFLDAAVAAARALVWGQLESGGWDYKVDFSAKGEKRWAYRHLKLADLEGRRNTSTLDDNNTQHALRLLMAVDQLVADAAIHEAVAYGLRALLEAQLPKGGWPQRFFLTPPATQRYAETVRIGPDGTRTTVKRPVHYAHYYTYNDATLNDCISTLLEAHRRYQRPEYIEGVRKAGQFVLLSQLEPPQAGWAQQYTPDLEPEWARRFEPKSVCSAVTVRNVHTLIDFYLTFGDAKYLEPIPAALHWLERSKLPGEGSRWARFYELGTNRPLYFTRKYELTYKPDDLPTHYGFVSNYGGDRAAARFREVKAKGRDALLAERDRKPTPADHRATAKALTSRVRSIIAALDDRGRWTRNGWIEVSTFNHNLTTLAGYVAAANASR